MSATAELVSQLRASLSHGVRLKDAERVLQSLQDELLVPRGLYLNGGLAHFGDDSDSMRHRNQTVITRLNEYEAEIESPAEK